MRGALAAGVLIISHRGFDPVQCRNGRTSVSVRLRRKAPSFAAYALSSALNKTVRQDMLQEDA